MSNYQTTGINLQTLSRAEPGVLFIASSACEMWADDNGREQANSSLGTKRPKLFPMLR